MSHFLRRIAEIAQVVERRPEKPGVPSASLGLGIRLRRNVPPKLPHENMGAKENKSGSRHSKCFSNPYQKWRPS